MYYASRLADLVAPGFLPSNDDLIHLYLPTVGSKETRLEVCLSTRASRALISLLLPSQSSRRVQWVPSRLLNLVWT